MDEPFASLDEQTRLLLGDKVLQIQQQLKQTTLLITHNITEAVQLSDRVVVMTYRPGKVKRMVEIALPRPRSSEIVSSEAFGRYVAQIWSDLREEASRGLIDEESRKLQRRRDAMTAAAALAKNRYFPAALGLVSFVAFVALIELLIRVGVINRFIVPLPSDIIAAFPRVIVEEHVLAPLPAHRRRGVLRQHPGRRFSASRAASALPLPPAAPRDRDLGGGGRGGAAGADVSALSRDLRQQRAHHRDDGLHRRAWRRSSSRRSRACPATRRVLINVGRSFNLTPSQQFWKILFPAALPTIFVGLRLGLDLRADQYRRASSS